MDRIARIHYATKTGNVERGLGLMNDSTSAAHISFVRLDLARPVFVFVPPVHRFMDARFISALKETGALRLASFAVFHQHETAHQGDKNEGHSFAGANDVVADRSFWTYSVVGTHAYVLSATTRSGPGIQKDFGPSSFEIVDPLEFCATVAAEIPYFAAAKIGHCIYVDQKMLVTPGSAPTVEDLRHAGNPDQISLEKVLQASTAITGDKPLFLKDRQFEYQCEYRFIWETSKPVDSHLDIVAPGLAKFCRFS